MTSIREWHANFKAGCNAFLRRNALSMITLGLVVSLVSVFFFNRIFISIYPGQLGVLWRRLGEDPLL